MRYRPVRADRKMFASEHWGVVPDIMTVAKSLGGGIYPFRQPYSRKRSRTFFIPHPFITFPPSAVPTSDAIVGLASSTIYKSTICDHAEKMGKRFRAGFDALLKEYPTLLLEVRQKGLMMGCSTLTNPSVRA